MYQPNQGELIYIKQGMAENFRISGRSNGQFRNINILNDVLKNSISSNRIQIKEDNIEIYCGIKLQIIEIPEGTNEGAISISIDSMKRREDEYKINHYYHVDNQSIKQLTFLIEQLYIQNIDKKVLVLIKDKLAFKIIIDIFTLNYIDVSLLDLMVLGVNKALCNLRVPELQLLFNPLDQKYQIDLIEGKENIKNLKLNLPYLFTIGEVSKNLVVDLDFKEQHAVDSKIVVVVRNEQVMELMQIGDGVLSPELLIKINKFSINAAKTYQQL